MGWILTGLSMLSGFSLTGAADTAENIYWRLFKAVAGALLLILLFLVILWKSGFLPAWLNVVGKSFEAASRVFSPSVSVK